MAKVCQKCHHGCHCNDDLHSDIYGVCPCEKCKCKEVKGEDFGGLIIDDEDECLSCQ